MALLEALLAALQLPVKRRIFMAGALSIALGACADPAETLGPPVPVVIEFKALVGAKPFSCGQQYAGVGQSGSSTIEASDFRFYVHDVRLIDKAGTAVPVELAADGKWQHEGLALLDFEDKTGSCTGTSDVNTQVRGTVPAAKSDWQGVRFKLGVPFALNHSDVATAPSPLNLTSMFWSWQGGYKFVRIEGANAGGKGFIVHLGSTGCVKDGSGAITACQSPNVSEIALDGFNPSQQGIAVDLAALFSGTDLSKEVECMSGPGAADCPAIFDRFGLAYEPAASGTQRLFRVE